MLADGLFAFGSKILERLFPDETQRQEAKLKLVELQQKGELAVLAAETDLLKGQLEINKVEAAHTNIFISGWRPFIGWVCGISFAYAFVIQPFMTFLLLAAGKPVTLPQVDFAELSPVLLGMLGLGTMRTVEKINKVNKY